jgi:heat shock protein HslJ
MRYTSNFLIVGILLMFIVNTSCKNQKASSLTSPPDMHTSQTSLDWSGVYTGTLPCADCEGIKTTLTLEQDGNFTQQWQYLGKSDDFFEMRGTFEWNENGNTITLVNEASTTEIPKKFMVGENYLQQLDLEGNKIEGDLAENYVLMKIPEKLTTQEWKLIELNAKSIPGEKQLNSMPKLTLNAGGRITGNGSCNQFFGTYKLEPGNRIHFSGIGATKMYCPEMEVETQLFDALSKAESYMIKGDTLILTHKGTSLARFVALSSDTGHIIIKAETGEFERNQSVITIPFSKLRSFYDERMALYLIQDGNKVPVPFQINTDPVKTLVFQTPEKTPSGTTLTWHLVPEMSKKTDESMRVESDTKTYTLVKNGKKVLQYNAATVFPPEGSDEAYKRSGFIHPLYAPNGAVLTGIQPVDHMHHYGIMNPWTKTTFRGETVDFWNLKKMQGTVKHEGILNTQYGPVMAQIEAMHHHVAWPESTRQTLAMTERHIIRTFQQEDDRYLVEFEFHITPVEPITLEEYRYGGFLFRGNEGWSTNTSNFVTSEGLNRDQADGERARWAIVTGETPQGQAGVLFMGHPNNFNHPEPLRVWPSDANNGVGNVFINFSPTRNTSWPLQPGQTYTLKYRALVFDGEIDTATAEKYWNDFAHPLEVGVGMLR